MEENETIISITEDKKSLVQTKDDVKLLLELFEFHVSEEELPYIEIKGLEKWRISFINNLTHEVCSGFYTNKYPSYNGGGPSNSDDERYLGQRIESGSIIKNNWFIVDGVSVLPDWTYVPPFKRDRYPLIQSVFINEKNPDGEFVLLIQKDFPESDQKNNFVIEVYKGNTSDLFLEGEESDILEPDPRKMIIKMDYSTDIDYNYYQTGQLMEHGKLFEDRYIYGRNKSRGYNQNEENCLPDNRVAYGMEHEEYSINYYGIIAEDGTNEFDEINPLGMNYLQPPLEEFEKAEEQPISKAYFQGYGQNIGSETIGIIKNEDGIRVVRDEMHYDESARLRGSTSYIRVLDEIIPTLSEGSITIDELKETIKILKENNSKDIFVQAVCNEIEIFIGRKEERKNISENEVQILDLCNPNEAVQFNFEDIIRMVKEQGEGEIVSNILNSYSDIFRTDKDKIISCNDSYKNQNLNR